ncbi:hypothetical protein BCR39DRAFT_555255 [Naematelia encephala]|uniref:Uncharacterized protein n=1 Tax=Naematelia encephala TaxID=71784 RepID=A0A1Y2AE35_9TREE|nr:hypothetical protein BCR39DRAFT_555255 [Naematelia encephala]
MPDYLTVTYPSMSSTFLPPGDYMTGSTPATYPLSARASVSSTGTLPGLASASDSDDVSPPLSPIRTSPELGRPCPQVVRSSSQSRPSLRHMPSWASFISHRSSKTTTSAGASSNLESDAEDDDIDAEYVGNPVYADAVNEHGVLMIPFKKISRERETSSKSSRKLRSGLSVFKRFATLRHRPQPLPSSSFTSPIGLENNDNLNTKSLLEYSDNLRILDIGKPGFKWYADTNTNTNTNTNRESNRIDTPLSMPSLKLCLRPQLESRLATMAEVSPPLTSPEGDDERDQDDAADEFFTPLPIHSAVLPAIAKLGNSTHFPPPPGRRRFVSTRKTQQLSKDAMQDAEPEQDPSLTFDLDIFSPRAPAAPILRGVMDTAPISPLTLPAPGPGISALLGDTNQATNLFPMNPHDNDDGSIRQSLPSHDTRGSIVSLYTALSSSPVQPSPSPSHPRTDIQSRPGSVRFATGPRRLSAIMRPPIRPTPTPPSLLASPRALGTPRLPSATNLSPTTSKYKSSPTPPKYKKGVPTLCHIPYASEPESVLETIKNRRASRMSLISPSGSLRLCALGLQPSEDNIRVVGKNGASEDGRTHVATPGTFGMQGEAERRLVLEGVNPYFA